MANQLSEVFWGMFITTCVDDTTTPLTYNPSTRSVSAVSYAITGTPATASVASTFGQVGLVKVATVQVAITGYNKNLAIFIITVNIISKIKY